MSQKKVKHYTPVIRPTSTGWEVWYTNDGKKYQLYKRFKTSDGAVKETVAMNGRLRLLADIEK
jgi:hypothetical protein